MAPSAPTQRMIAAAAWHMCLGMREILEDYVRKGTLRALLALNRLFGLAVALAAGAAILKLWLWS